MNKKSFITGILTGVAGSLLVVLVAVFLLVQNGSLNVTRMIGISDNHTALENKIMDKVNVIEGYIDQYFLDKIDEDKMADAVYKGVINGLNDTYAAYYTSDEYKDIMEKTQGSYCGIGAYVSADQDSGAITIVKPMKDSPCEKAGAKAGDIIYSVDGTEVTGKEISQVQAMLKGEKGTKVDMVLLRGQKQVKITVTRDNIEEDTVAYQMLDKKIGYIQVSGFEEVTAKQFEQAVDELEKQGEKALIIDLRENGGGLLESAVKMLDRMLPKGVVVYSKDKSGTKEEYKATNYESDLTDKQWEAIKEFFPSGNKSKYHKRSLVEAVLYIVKTGCQWRMLPHDYPPHDTVWSFYRRARENGVWDKMMKHLVKITRKQAGRNEEPSYALIDSQSVKTTCYGENHGYDGGKKRREENGTL